MTPSKHNRFMLRILTAVFIPDYRKLYRLYIQIRITQLSMECFLRELSPKEATRLELIRINLRMTNLQRTIQQLSDMESPRREIVGKQGKPILRIHRLLDRLETEVENLARNLQS